MANFERVYFELDSSRLSPDARAALDENITLLQQRPDLKVEVQGHADERGTTDYNLALGARRAETVRNYMTKLGVAPERVTVLSYGEERPAAQGQGETVWSKNRRAEFRVTQGSNVRGTL